MCCNVDLCTHLRHTHTGIQTASCLAVVSRQHLPTLIINTLSAGSFIDSVLLQVILMRSTSSYNTLPVLLKESNALTMTVPQSKASVSSNFADVPLCPT